jgi:hypothetical protein
MILAGKMVEFGVILPGRMMNWDDSDGEGERRGGVWDESKGFSPEKE